MAMSEDELKAKGNEAFKNKRFEEAVEHFTRAIEINPANHVLYSNRSAAQASLKRFAEALEDAKMVVQIKPDWPRGYSRLGAAHHGLGELRDALKSYKQGLTIDPTNTVLLESKEELEQEMQSSMRSPFNSTDFMNRLLSDSRTSPLMVQPDFMAMLRDLQTNPSNMMRYMNDPRMQLVMEVGLGLDLASANAPTEETPPPPTPPQEPVTMPQEPKKEPEPEPEPQMGAGQQEAIQEKEAGNAAYKKRQFAKAIEHYTKALSLYDQDITFLTNRAAVYFEMGEFENCIKDCEEAETRGGELHSDFKLIAKALTRKGKALVKLERFEEAIEIFNRSLTEHRNAETLKALQDTEKILKERKEQDYINLELSVQEKEAGNEAFKIQDYPTAVKHYTEALKRGPISVNDEAYKLYSNRAACYTKLGAWSDGLKDAEKCIELKPDFSRGYIRKGQLQFLMKEYEKAMETFKAGLELDPANEEMKDGIQRCIEQISRFARGDASETEMQERRSKAMADPEIQGILTDPIMAQVLKDFESDPRGAQKHLKNPEIMRKLNKLMTAGIVKVQ
eukprot:g129.t1